MESNIIIRNGKPNKYDQAPQGALCKVITSLSQDCDLYKQISSHDDEPIWEFIGTTKKDSVIPPLI